MDTELFWSIVGDRVQSWFLYHIVLTKEQFIDICKKVREEVQRLEI